MLGQDNILDFHIDKLYRNYFKLLVEYAFSYVHKRDVAEDIAQEAFLSLNNHSLNFSTERALRSYLFTSARNLSLDIIKHQKVEQRYSEHYTVENCVDIPYWENQMDHDIMEMLFTAIDKLPKRCREIFLLHMDGHTNEQIALQFDISVETVKTQKKRAMKFLRDKFSDTDNLKLYMFLTILATGI
ncbi:MAG: RNA polymerase sigma-70 factor [Bacteroidales bacterium]|nr:RNA polymerase sigma-70 factor [Bacteroidales bacterium]